MDSGQFLVEYKKFLKDNYNLEKAKKEKAYLYSDMVHYGVYVTEKRTFLKEHKNWLNSLSKKQALHLIKSLWEKPSFEEKGMALGILELHKDKLNIKDMPLIEKLMRESKGWALLDSLIIPLMPTILEKDKNAYRYLKKWIKDKDFWVKRSALLAQLLFFRSGEGGNRKLFFDMAKDMFDESWIDEVYKDSEQRKRARFFIRKAIGWTLREMSIKNPKVVFEFLKENKNQMSGLTLREGSRKLPANLRKRL